MTRIYTLLRLTAYATGLAGMALFVTARHDAKPQTVRAAAGGILLILSFLCFLGTYAIYLAVRLGKGGKR